MSQLRGAGVSLPANPERVGLPARPFLYTTDQIATLLSLDEKTVKAQYLFYEGRSTGKRKLGLMVARNIADPKNHPQWRVSERELIRWLRFKGFRIYETGVIST